MLKIVRSVDQDAVRLTLSGRIDQAEVAELAHAIGRERSDVRALTLDLEDVRLLDRDAVLFLIGCEQSGVRLANVPAYIRGWMKAEQTRAGTTFEG